MIPNHPFFTMSFIQKLKENLPYSEIPYTTMAKKYSIMLRDFLLWVNSKKTLFMRNLKQWESFPRYNLHSNLEGCYNCLRWVVNTRRRYLYHTSTSFQLFSLSYQARNDSYYCTSMDKETILRCDKETFFGWSPWGWYLCHPFVQLMLLNFRLHSRVHSSP